MSCCGSCRRGRKCDGRNPLSRKETASILRSARHHLAIARRLPTASGRHYNAGKAAAEFAISRYYGEGGKRSKRLGRSTIYSRAVAINPNFLRLANRRGRRNPAPAGNDWIYQMNRGKKRRVARDRRGRFKRRGR